MKRLFFCLLFLGLSLAVNSSASAASNDGVVSRMTAMGQMSDAQARGQLDLVFNAIKEELKAGSQVSIKNFGKFSVTNRNERTGRNPRTGEALKIPAKRYARFNAADNFKNELNPNVGKATPVVQESADPIQEQAKAE